MKNYLQAIRQVFSRELTRHLAARLGESENALGKALTGLFPILLCQLVIRTSEGEGRELLALIMEADWLEARGLQNVTELLALLGGGPDNSGALDVGESLLGRLFGPGRPELEGFISNYAGVRPDSATIILRLVAAVLAAGLARYARQQLLTVTRLNEELTADKNLIYSWLPADLPRWPGFRRRTAVKAPHAVLAAKLAQPYWVLVLAVLFATVLALLALKALA